MGDFPMGLKNIIIIIIITTVSPGCSGQGIIYNVVGTGGGLMHGEEEPIGEGEIQGNFSSPGHNSHSHTAPSRVEPDSQGRHTLRKR
jgi:hypothetical protein